MKLYYSVEVNHKEQVAGKEAVSKEAIKFLNSKFADKKFIMLNGSMNSTGDIILNFTEIE